MLITLTALLANPVPICHSLGLVHFGGGKGGVCVRFGGGGGGGCFSFREGVPFGGVRLGGVGGIVLRGGGGDGRQRGGL